MNKKQNLRVGIAGAGVFGGYHAAKMMAHEQVDFVGIYDPVHPARAQALAAEHGAQAVGSRDELIEVADALIIASPASAHGRQAIDALGQGLHVLVEKPIATEMEQAREMIALSDQKNLILQVGHQERFVCDAIGLYDVPEKPLRISASRCHPFSSRGCDVTVTLDLMVHDLDMVCALAGDMPVASTPLTKLGPSGSIDETSMRMQFKNGLQVDLLASRMVENSERVMEIVYPSGRVHVDFLTKTLIHDTPFDLNLSFADEPMAKDSLGASDNAFIDAVLAGKPVPVSGLDGAKALMLALEADSTKALARDIAV